MDELFTDKEGDEEVPEDTGVCIFKSLFSCILPTTADEGGSEGIGVVVGVSGTGVVVKSDLLGSVAAGDGVPRPAPAVEGVTPSGKGVATVGLTKGNPPAGIAVCG